MDFLKLARDRFSVRKFSDKVVEKEKIAMILKAGQLAPTACNRQPQIIYVIQSKEALEKLQKCKMSHFGETLAFLICVDRQSCWIREEDNKSSHEIDGEIVATHMMLAACDLGIGSTWIMHFIPEALHEEFDIPETQEPNSLLVMGYPSEDAKPSVLHEQTKVLEDMVRFL